MTFKLISLALRKSTTLLPLLGLASNMALVPLASAAIYNESVDLNTTPLANGDKVIVSDATGVYSSVLGTGALQLGTGSIKVEVNNTLSDQNIFGIDFSNQLSNDLGIGTTIKVVQHAPDDDSTSSAIGVNLGSETNLSASNLRIEVTSSTAGSNVTGIKGGTGSIIELGNSSTISINAMGNAQGIMLDENGKLDANGIKINVKSDAKAIGIGSSSGANIDLGRGSQINVEGSSTATSDSAAIWLGSQGNLTADNLKVNAINGNGIVLADDTHVNLGSNSTITVTGEGVAGIVMDPGATFIADALTVHTTGVETNAIEVSDGEITLGSGSLLQADAGAGLLVSTQGGNANATLNDSKIIANHGYAAQAKGENALINLNNIAIEVDGDTTSGLLANDQGGINVNDLNLQATSGAAGIVANTQGKVTLAGDIKINTAGGKAMMSDGADSAITGSGNMQITGTITAQNSGLIDLSMTEGSVFKGSTAQSDGSVNLAMDNALWFLDNNATLNNLALTNGSVVKFETPNYGVLTINNLSGNGMFEIRTDLRSGNTDVINVTGSSAGSHRVDIANSANSASNGKERVTIIKTADGEGQFSLTHQVELGGYVYDIHQTGNNWDLYSSGMTSTAKASASFLNTGYLMGYAEIQALLQHMRDVRQGSGDDNVWVRIFHGTFDAFADNKLGDFDMRYNGLQLGTDKATPLSDSTIYSGIFLGLSDSTQNYDNGDGSLKSMSVGLYASYVADSGFYLDNIFKYQNYRNKLSVTDSIGMQVNGRGTTNGLSASFEGGYRFHLNETQFGLYIEPQLQLTYGWQDSVKVNNSNGLRVGLDSYNTVLGRAGALIGYEVTEARKLRFNLYFKSSWLYEFDGKMSYSLNGAQEDLSFKGSAWLSSIGTSLQLNNRHTVFLDIDRTTGNQYDQNQINLGYRYSF